MVAGYALVLRIRKMTMLDEGTPTGESTDLDNQCTQRQPHLQFGLSVLLETVLVVAGFCAMLRGVGLIAIAYFLFGVGTLVALDQSVWRQRRGILEAAIGGAFGCAFGIAICLALNPPQHWVLDPLTAVLLFAFWGAIGGLILGVVFYISSRIHDRRTNNQTRFAHLRRVFWEVYLGTTVLVCVLEGMAWTG
jgi:hypothetical protein